jgi:hypothetical protein
MYLKKLKLQLSHFKVSVFVSSFSTYQKFFFNFGETGLLA